MAKQAGFTLIELLLVLAIIGIISAIAIPAMLSQRARARDKASMDHVAGRIADLVGQWDKAREAGITASQAVGSLQNYLQATATKDLNPWTTVGASAAFNFTITPIAGQPSASAFAKAIGLLAKPGNMGQVQLATQAPGPGTPGFIGGAVYLNASSTADVIPHVRAKVTAIE
ncbi:MAG TPA: prepilin-type N-terminal cleavage/methylation domain-containing protein [Holophagaceae bacterium]|jgi:prepilin-type N-terminal cleavage/methylation domain-containing protein|nr:prepilin-type N-terminal cleavage/methylation domain-containing protein [Holophagaceae bacterium]